MSRWTILVWVVAIAVAGAAPAEAQRFTFERSFDVTAASILDASTIRGKIEVVAGDASRIVVSGAATVRIGWDVPANAVEIAQQVANAPPIERDGNTIRLRPPGDAAAKRAVTVNYQVRVPPNTEVRTTSDSGATTVRGVAAAVTVHTQSGAIDVASLGGAASLSSGSGAVAVAGVAGALSVTSSSSSFTGTALGSSVRVRTQSGAVDATLTGDGDVDVESGSSAIHVRNLRGGLSAKTESGRISVDGAPARSWTVTTGSSSVNLSVLTDAAFSLDARTRSGSVAVPSGIVQGSIAKREVKGTVKGGGPLVQVVSRSGSIRLRTGAQD